MPNTNKQVTNINEIFYINRKIVYSIYYGKYLKRTRIENVLVTLHLRLTKSKFTSQRAELKIARIFTANGVIIHLNEYC